MRIPALLLSLALGACVASRLPAQDPGAQQDAEAAREKLLKAEDELENIQANSEATKTAVDGMKTDVATLQATVTQLQSDNAALKQQLADMQAALDQYKAEQMKERQALIDNVAGMIAAAKGPGTTKSVKKKKDTTASQGTTETATPGQASGAQAGVNPPPDSASITPGAAATGDAPPAPVKPPKGYYHVVADGETLTLICAAYRENGVNVTVSEIRRANGLTATSVLKTGQKLFIPKPGT